MIKKLQLYLEFPSWIHRCIMIKKLWIYFKFPTQYIMIKKLGDSICISIDGNLACLQRRKLGI